MKRFLNKLFSKLVLGAVIIILQFGWFVYLIYGATTANSVANLCLQIAAVALALYVANKDIRTSYKMSWIFLILFLPMFGLPAYFIFGRSGLTRGTRRKFDEVDRGIQEYLGAEEETEKEIEELDFYAYQQSRYITVNAKYPLYREEDSQYYSSGEEAFKQMLADLETAEKFIFMEYFIVEQGKMFDAVLEILERKVKQGVEVRFIYDDVGSIQTLPPKYYNVLREKGIQCVCFNQFRPLMSIIMNITGKLWLLTEKLRIRAALIWRMNISMKSKNSDIGKMRESV